MTQASEAETLDARSFVLVLIWNKRCSYSFTWVILTKVGITIARGCKLRFEVRWDSLNLGFSPQAPGT